MRELKIAFIGAGNMATSIVGGLLEQGMPASQLCAADPFMENLKRLQDATGITTAKSNSKAIAGADVVILAVKPQVMKGVYAEISAAIAEHQPLLISIAAGITIASMEQGLGAATSVVRCMPNTPALLGAGATALYANNSTRSDQRFVAEQILRAVGITSWVATESELDAVTALSGSGPAYFFLFIEAMCNTAVKLGLDENVSRELAIQTALGASQMAAAGDGDVVELRRRVTSPGGTTQAAVESLEASDLRGIIEQAMQAALDRAQAMAKEMG